MNKLKILSDENLKAIHDTSLRILRDIGVEVPNDELLKSLANAGAEVDFSQSSVKIPENLITDSLSQASKKFILYGRDREKRARFGYGDFVLPSSAGQFVWIEGDAEKRRDATSEDFKQAVIIGDALEHIDIVGGLALPCEIPEAVRDVYMTGQLVKITTKPSHVFIANSKTFQYILEIYETVAGGKKEHRKYPMLAAFVEPISPLRFDRSGLAILVAAAKNGLPVYFGPMVQTAATGPATLAGTIAVENAEILAGIVITQLLNPGCPVGYGGSCHTMDMRTMMISFGAPEQCLLAVAMAQMPQYYGLPALFNAGLTDSKRVDAQAGLEKGMTMLIGALAGIETFAHMGICGADQGACLEQLIIDNETAGYVKRILKGFVVNQETLALDAIKRVGIGGNFLSDEHTLAHFRNELWLPEGFNRQNWDAWEAAGAKTMYEWAHEKKESILANHKPEPIDSRLADEIDKIVDVAFEELVESQQ